MNHLARYVNEFTFRLNEGSVNRLFHRDGRIPSWLIALVVGALGALIYWLAPLA